MATRKRASRETQVATEGWVNSLIDWEEQERARRSLERRLREARIGRFKPICDFDWSWPKRCAIGHRRRGNSMRRREFIAVAPG